MRHWNRRSPRQAKIARLQAQYAAAIKMQAPHPETAAAVDPRTSERHPDAQAAGEAASEADAIRPPDRS